MREGLVRALRGEPTGAHWRALAAALSPLALTYSAGLKAYLLSYRIGLRKRHRLGCAVVSVGNLSSGGTGKTGLVISLARALTDAGLRCCILNRGYRGRNENDVAVVSDGSATVLGPDEAGDEAYLLATSLPGTPVVVGRDRRKSGTAALDKFDPQVIVLDDGMQYYQLHRDLEITLLDAARPFGNGLTLPAGILREPPGHLRRSDWVILSGPLPGECGRPLFERVRRCAGHERLARGEYRCATIVSVNGDRRLKPGELKGRNVATMCGLGNPGAFESMVTALGANVVHRTRFPDHHVPDPAGLDRAMLAARRSGAELTLVTPKDEVKLPPIAGTTPVYVVHAVYEVDRLPEVVDDVKRVVRSAAHFSPAAESMRLKLRVRAVPSAPARTACVSGVGVGRVQSVHDSGTMQSASGLPERLQAMARLPSAPVSRSAFV